MSLGSFTTVDCGTFTAIGDGCYIAGRVLLDVDYERHGLLVLELTDGRKTAVVLLGAAEHTAFASAVASIKLDIRKLPAAQLLAKPEWLGIVNHSTNRDVILTGGGKGRGGGVMASLEVDATMQAHISMCFADGPTRFETILGRDEWLSFLTCWRTFKGYVSKLTAGGNFHGFTELTPGTRH